VTPVYSNNVTIFSSPHDVRIVFTEIVNEDVKQDPTHQLRASVAVSHSHANQLLQSLTLALEKLKTVSAPAAKA
jgi:hypothetical protein